MAGTAATAASTAAVGYVVATAAAEVEHNVALAAAIVDFQQAGLSPKAARVASEGGAFLDMTEM